ncbi:MAG: methyltransferase domain-containing protein [Myxococcota bacterium]
MQPALSSHECPDRLRREGEAFYLRGECALAQGCFQRALEIDPDHAPSHQNLGVYYFDRGDLARAREHLGSAIRIDPGNASALLNLAILELAQARIDPGMLYLAQALRVDPALCAEAMASATELLAGLPELEVLDLLATSQMRGHDPASICAAGQLLGVAAPQETHDRGDPLLCPQRRRHRDLVEFLGDEAVPLSSRVLDVGCGTGWLAESLREAGFDAISGCDWCPGDRISSGARSFLDYRRLDLNAEGLARYEDAAFDLIVCSDVLEHLENPAWMLREMARVTRSSGDVFLSIPNAFNVFERVEILQTGNSSRYARSAPQEHGHISMLPLNVLESLCERAGLQIVATGTGYCLWRGYFWYPARRFDPTYSFVCHFRLRKRDGR